MNDLAKTITLIHGSTDRSWEMTTDFPTEDEQGIILLQFLEGTDPDAVEKLRVVIEHAVRGILGG